MTTAALKAILRKSGDAANQTRPVDGIPLDFTRPFMPEDRTQLYYTPLYRRLTDAQRLRYNQLFAVRVNEYIMTLESDIVAHFLVPLRRHRRVRANTDLVRCLDTMIAEERRHYAMFRDLNRRCLPDVFVRDRERYFTTLPAAVRPALRGLSVIARTAPFPIWFVMAMEEEAIDLARAMVRQPQTETLGDLDPGFVAVHREHMKDEARHIAIDKHLADACLMTAGARSRRLSAALFKWTMKAMTRVGANGPGARVIRHLVEDRPELVPMEGDLIAAIVALNGSRAYHGSLFNRNGAPVSFQMFDRMPEFADLGRSMVGYDRR